MIRISLLVPPVLWAQAHRLAWHLSQKADRSVSASEVIREALAEKLAREGNLR